MCLWNTRKLSRKLLSHPALLKLITENSRLGPEMERENSFKELLESVFWLCSASEYPMVTELRKDKPGFEWLWNNRHAFPEVWLSTMQQDIILNSPVIGK